MPASAFCILYSSFCILLLPARVLYQVFIDWQVGFPDGPQVIPGHYKTHIVISSRRIEQIGAISSTRPVPAGHIAIEQFASQFPAAQVPETMALKRHFNIAFVADDRAQAFFGKVGAGIVGKIGPALLHSGQSRSFRIRLRYLYTSSEGPLASFNASAYNRYRSARRMVGSG